MGSTVTQAIWSLKVGIWIFDMFNIFDTSVMYVGVGMTGRDMVASS